MLRIPKTFGGRPVTTRGVHLHPSGNHGDWLKEVEKWIAYLISMHISWVVICSDDGAALPGEGGQVDRHGRSAVEALLQAGIIPILRFQPSRLPKPFTAFEWVRVFAELCARYGVPAFVQLANEPRDNREWVGKKAPWDWLEQYSAWFQKTASECIWPYGAIAVYADAPFLTRNPFALLHEDTLARFEQGDAVFGGHFYAHNLPYEHPFDAAAIHGLGITQTEYQAHLGVYAGNPHWQDPPTVETMNLTRLAMREPEPDIMDYPVCWNGWMRIAQWMTETFGKVLPMAMTEGGWTPHARHDDRYPYATYDSVAENTLRMLDAELEFNGEPVQMFARCPWLLADELMCGGSAVGWSQEAWIGTWEHGLWGFEKPVVTALQANPPPGQPVVPGPEPDPEPGDPGDWVMEVVLREPGLGLIIGRLPEAGIPVVAMDPWGNVQITESGSKAEFGPGGFEVSAPNAGTYPVSFLGLEYDVAVGEEETVWVVWF